MSPPVAITVRVAVAAGRPQKFKLNPFRNPVRELVRVRKEFARSKKEYDRRLYGVLQVACVIALQLERDLEAWRTLATHRFWPKPLPRELPKFEKRLRLVLMFELSYSSERRRCISRNAKAVINLLNAGVSPEQTAEQLGERGGIAKCAKRSGSNATAKERERGGAEKTLPARSRVAAEGAAPEKRSAERGPERGPSPAPRLAPPVTLEMRHAFREMLRNTPRNGLVVISAVRKGSKCSPTLEVKRIL